MNENEDLKNRVMPSTLYLVGTPIGNLSDISPRAVKVLSECDFISEKNTESAYSFKI